MSPSERALDADLRILDPVTRGVVFHARNSAGWGRKARPPFDQCVLYPLFNAFIDWVEKTRCQPALDRDPLSACNFAPPLGRTEVVPVRRGR